MSIDFSGYIDSQRIAAGGSRVKPQETHIKAAGMVGTGRADIGIPKTPVDGDAVLQQSIEKLKELGNLFNKRLDFRVDETTHRVVVKVIDTETDKVIKEIPPEQILHIAARMQEMIGLLVDEER